MPVVIGAYVVAVAANAASGGCFWLVPGERLHPSAAAVGRRRHQHHRPAGLKFFAPYAWGIARDRTGSFHAGLTALPVFFLIAAVIVLALRRGAPRLVAAPA